MDYTKCEDITKLDADFINSLSDKQLREIFLSAWTKDIRTFIKIHNLDEQLHIKWLVGDFKYENSSEAVKKELVEFKTKNFISPSDLSKFFSSLNTANLYLLDGDNFIDDKNAKLTMEHSLILVFHSTKTPFEKIKSPFIRYCKVDSRNDIGEILKLAMSFASDKLPLESNIQVVNSPNIKKTILAQVACLKLVHPKREINIISPESFANKVFISETKTITESLPILIEEDSFYQFINLLNDKYIFKNEIEPLLSQVGVIMRRNKIYTKKGDMKPLVKKAVDLGLVEQKGSLGLSAIVLNQSAIEKYLA